LKKKKKTQLEIFRSASRGDIVFVELERKVNNEQGLVLTEKRKLAYFKQKGDPSKATKLPGIYPIFIRFLIF
jgi:hydroxyacyl-ACP dehydratase HTD2-like protein with hotdog domain